MAINDTVITIRGWAGADPTFYHNEHSGEQTGNVNSAANVSAVLNVGVTPRNYNRQTGQYADGETAWYSVRTFGRLAENVNACVHKGMPLIVRGKLTARSFQGKDGTTKMSQVIVADALGIEISNGTAQYLRASSGNSMHPSVVQLADTELHENAADPLTSAAVNPHDALIASGSSGNAWECAAVANAQADLADAAGNNDMPNAQISTLNLEKMA